MGGRIFVSYRRDDSAGEAGRLADHLQRRFGADRVFLDVDSIAPGTDFARVLTQSLQQTSAVLVVIGREWLDIRNAAGQRRLDNAADYVRLEVEAALGRDVPVVPVLVQGARLPAVESLPPSLAPLVRRQTVVLDHAEFHADAERLCDQLAPLIAAPADAGIARRPFPRAAIVVAIVVALAAALGGYRWYAAGVVERARLAAEEAARVTAAQEVQRLMQAAEGQRQRGQFKEAVGTLDRALAVDAASVPATVLQEDIAMEWLRDLRVGEGTTFEAAMKVPLAVVDRGVPAATGARKADLLAHAGWATFLLRRSADERLDPSPRYRDALAVDPENPYANAMLAHWTLWQRGPVAAGAALFAKALRSGRDTAAVRRLQWAAYNNADGVDSKVEMIRLADAMRRAKEPVSGEQAQRLWGVYYFALPAYKDDEFQALLGAVTPDDYIATLAWAFDDYVAGQSGRMETRRLYVAALHARAGRVAQARMELETLHKELARSPGTLQDAVRRVLAQVSQGRG